MTSDWVISLGHFCSSQSKWLSTVDVVIAAYPPCQMISVGTLSTPGDFPTLRLRTSSVISVSSMGGLSSSGIVPKMTGVRLKRIVVDVTAVFTPSG
ncbi:hypothetical protein DPMN_168546 [Dreissena polymorpha]|uniref:Uncharacterized protein n=1 Tax=Dreissena polymorpha TaxID=45954 RepID=A0A9D4F3J5_DREPO|nr:hypothetical protein DPMN_168546 [Dreissena polymorpha]